MLLEKALEKVVNNAIVQMNEATTEAIDKTIKKSVEKILGNCVESAVEDAVSSVVEGAVEDAVQDAVSTTVESAVEDAVESVVKKAVEKTVEAAVQNVVQKAVEKAVETAVGNAVEKAVENSMGKYLDRSHEPVSSQPPEPHDASQDVSQTDVVSEIPETQQDSMEVDLATGNIVGATNYNDNDSKREEAALNEFLSWNLDYTRLHPGPHIETLVWLDFMLSVDEDMHLKLLTAPCAIGYLGSAEKEGLCRWECYHGNGWLRFRNVASRKHLGVDSSHSNGAKRFLLTLFDDIEKKETRFYLQLATPNKVCLQFPIGSQVYPVQPTLGLIDDQTDTIIEGEIALESTESEAGPLFSPCSIGLRGHMPLNELDQKKQTTEENPGGGFDDDGATNHYFIHSFIHVKHPFLYAEQLSLQSDQ